jgi:hypothetical protein
MIFRNEVCVQRPLTFLSIPRTLRTRSALGEGTPSEFNLLAIRDAGVVSISSRMRWTTSKFVLRRRQPDDVVARHCCLETTLAEARLGVALLGRVVVGIEPWRSSEAGGGLVMFALGRQNRAKLGMDLGEVGIGPDRDLQGGQGGQHL